MKTNVKNRFNKNCIPKGDPDARLSAFAIFTGKGKKIQYFWGYRNHIINDATTELPLVEITKPANVHGSTLGIQNLGYAKETLGLNPKAVIGDSKFDSSPKGLVSTANTCTIAHITVLAVAHFAITVKE